MAMSQLLVDSFTKAILSNNQTNKKTTHYGTIVKNNNVKYVKLDGSPAEILTPMVERVTCNAGDRVSVEIINRRCIVNANLNNK